MPTLYWVFIFKHVSRQPVISGKQEDSYFATLFIKQSPKAQTHSSVADL